MMLPFFVNYLRNCRIGCRIGIAKRDKLLLQVSQYDTLHCDSCCCYGGTAEKARDKPQEKSTESA